MWYNVRVVRRGRSPRGEKKFQEFFKNPLTNPTACAIMYSRGKGKGLDTNTYYGGKKRWKK